MESLMRMPDVIKRTGMCSAKIYRLEGFPKPVKIVRISVWVESEIAAWIDTVIQAARKTA